MQLSGPACNEALLELDHPVVVLLRFLETYQRGESLGGALLEPAHPAEPRFQKGEDEEEAAPRRRRKTRLS